MANTITIQMAVSLIGRDWLVISRRSLNAHRMNQRYECLTAFQIRINGVNALWAFTGYEARVGFTGGEYAAKPRQQKGCNTENIPKPLVSDLRRKAAPASTSDPHLPLGCGVHRRICLAPMTSALVST